MTEYLLFISGGEIFFIFGIALLLFGAKAIPDIARVMGKGVREFKKATNEIKREIEEGDNSGIKESIDEFSSSIKSSSQKIQDNINKQFED